MIGTLDILVNAKSPNLPLCPLRAFVNSPSSLRVANVPRKIGSWQINSVYMVAVYPDGTIKTAACVLTGGVWVGTIAGTSTSGTSGNGFTIFADGIDENGNAVTGYVLGKGDIEILEADGTLAPDSARYYVKLLSAEAAEPREGDLYPTADGYAIYQSGAAHTLGTPIDQISSLVDSAISGKADLSALNGKADLSALNGYIRNGADTAVIHDLTCDTLIANAAYIDGYAKSSDLSSKADISAVHGDYIVDGNGNAVSANLCYKAFNAETDWTAHNLTSEQDYHLSAESEYAYSWKSDWEWLTLEYSANKWGFRYKMFDGEEWWDYAEGEWQGGEDALELYRDEESWKMTRRASPTGKLATVAQLAEIPQLNDGRGNMISADLSYRQTQAFYDGWTVTGNGTGGELSADGGDTQFAGVLENGLYLTLRAIDPWQFELTQYHDEGGEWVYDWVDWAYCNINTAKSFELQGYTFARPIVKTGRLATESWVLDLLARLSAQMIAQ